MIGSSLARRLTGLGHHVIVVDNLWRGKREYLFDSHGEPVIDLDRDLHILDLAVPRSESTRLNSSHTDISRMPSSA